MNINNNNLLCPVCNKTSNYYKKLNEVTLFYCGNCSHRFTDVKSIKTIETYSQEYFKEKHPNWFENQNIKLFEYIHKKINENISKNLSVLDACCGQGDLLKYLSSKPGNMKLTGIDLHKNPPDKKINFISGDIFNTKFNEKFDVIVNLASIEHILDVKSYISLLKNLCKDDGIIITMTINDSSLVYAVARSVYNFGMKSPMERLYDKHHLNHFSMKSLEHLHGLSGLNIIEKPYTQWPMKSIDLPNNNKFLKIFYKIVLYLMFFVERISGKTILQTITARK